MAITLSVRKVTLIIDIVFESYVSEDSVLYSSIWWTNLSLVLPWSQFDGFFKKMECLLKLGEKNPRGKIYDLQSGYLLAFNR